uniref:Uncharacterized protein n=1 Tax=Helianthus annuus TaxID=4232 RepID=A0A1Y3BXJ4_HELAN
MPKAGKYNLQEKATLYFCVKDSLLAATALLPSVSINNPEISTLYSHFTNSQLHSTEINISTLCIRILRCFSALTSRF